LSPNLTEGPAATRDFRRSTKEEEEEEQKFSHFFYTVEFNSEVNK
jgi:hypothetical protein